MTAGFFIAYRHPTRYNDLVLQVLFFKMTVQKDKSWGESVLKELPLVPVILLVFTCGILYNKLDNMDSAITSMSKSLQNKNDEIAIIKSNMKDLEYSDKRQTEKIDQNSSYIKKMVESDRFLPKGE